MRDLKFVFAAIIGFAAANGFAIEPPAGNEPRRMREDIAYRRSLGHTRVITALAYTPDSKILIAASLDGKVRLWDAEATKVLRTLDTSSLELYAIAISPDGKLLASAGSWQEIQIWEIATGKLLHTLKGHSAQVAALAFSPDGKLLASGGYDKSIRLWDTGNWKERLKITKGPERVTSLAFSPDGERLASGGMTTRTVRGYENGESDHVRIWNSSTGKIKSELNVQGSNLTYLPDGQSVLAAGFAMQYTPLANGRVAMDGYAVTSWLDLQTGIQYLNTFKKSYGQLVAVAPSGRIFVTAYGYLLSLHLDGNIISSDKASPWGICLWEAANRHEFVRLPHTREKAEGYESAVTFSPDGRALAAGYFHGQVHVFGLVPGSKNPLPTKPKILVVHWDQLWSDLASQDSEVGYAAIWSLMSSPDKAVTELARHLEPVPISHEKTVARGIAELSDPAFANRQRAERQLRELGAEPALREAYGSAESAQLRKQLLEILIAVRTGPTSGDRLRETRALAVLEQIGTREAMAVLRKIASGSSAAALTRDAKESLRRLEAKKR